MKKKKQTIHTDCLGEGELLCYIDGNFTWSEQKDAEGHLEQCEKCSGRLGLLEREEGHCSRDEPNWYRLSEEEMDRIIARRVRIVSYAIYAACMIIPATLTSIFLWILFKFL